MAKRPVQLRRKTAISIAMWLGVVSILLIWATRLPGIAKFPFFIDEALHVYFSEITAQQHPFVYANKYYLLSIWWWTLFGVPFAAPIWLSRVVTLLIVLPGAAALIGLARQMVGIWGALFGGLLLLFSTYHFFFERLALADPISASAALVAIWFAYRLKSRLNARDAALAGFASFLAMGAKLSALPYLGVPVAAALLLRPPGVGRRERLHWLGVALLSEGILAGLYGLALVVVGRNPFANAADHVGLSDGGIVGVLARIPRSGTYMLENLQGWVGASGLAVIGVALLVLLLRRRFYLLFCLFPPALVFLLSDMQGSRYYAAPMSVLVLCVAIAFAEAARVRMSLAPLLAAPLFIWAILVWTPFAFAMNNAPLRLKLPAHEYGEYIGSDASGVGLDAARDVLLERGATRVIGMMANCHGLDYEGFQVLDVECPNINPNGETIPELRALMEANREDQVFVVLEALSYLPSTAPGRVIATVNSASNRPRLMIYQLMP